MDEQGAFHLLNMSATTVEVPKNNAKHLTFGTGFDEVKKLTINEQVFN